MINENDSIPITTAYVAMYKFIQLYYNLSKPEQIGDLLSGMAFLSDGRPADPAMWSDWMDAVELAVKGDCDIKLRSINGIVIENFSGNQNPE